VKTEFVFNDVIERCKKALKIKNDADFAARINMKPTTFNSRKKAHSLPYQEIIELATTEKLDLNWLLTGEGSMYKNETRENSPSYQTRSIHDLETLFDRLDDVEKQLSELKKRA
jgi:hypothetical protein